MNIMKLFISFTQFMRATGRALDRALFSFEQFNRRSRLINQTSNRIAMCTCVRRPFRFNCSIFIYKTSFENCVVSLRIINIINRLKCISQLAGMMRISFVFVVTLSESLNRCPDRCFFFLHVSDINLYVLGHEKEAIFFLSVARSKKAKREIFRS